MDYTNIETSLSSKVLLGCIGLHWTDLFPCKVTQWVKTPTNEISDLVRLIGFEWSKRPCMGEFAKECKAKTWGVPLNKLPFLGALFGRNRSWCLGDKNRQKIGYVLSIKSIYAEAQIFVLPNRSFHLLSQKVDGSTFSSFGLCPHLPPPEKKLTDYSVEVGLFK